MTGLSLLAFDQTYQDQTFYRDCEVEWTDLSYLPACRYCSQATWKILKKRLNGRRVQNKTFIGSNHYHHVTALLLETIKVPFTLVLFDHHADFLPSLDPSLISCGSWVRTVIEKNLFLTRLVLVGVRDDPLLYTIAERFNKPTDILGPQILKEERTLVQQRLHYLLRNQAVYISIDKDVLALKYAQTEWDPGKMTLDDLALFIQTIRQSAHVIGWDVCGDPRYHPITSVLPIYHILTKLNDHANRVVLEALESVEQTHHEWTG
jgi:arginase family enzyme